LALARVEGEKEVRRIPDFSGNGFCVIHRRAALGPAPRPDAFGAGFDALYASLLYEWLNVDAF
jgi:hypothetical protein